IFGAPFDSTTSFRPGARFGCSSIRNESFGIETFSPYQDKDLSETRVFDFGDLELPFGAPENALSIIESFAKQVLSDGKIPGMIGGEHLVTLGAVRAAYAKYPELYLIHFDAHMDLRDDYLGQKLSHATVMRRVWEKLGDNRIMQFGIRSGDRSEFLWAKGHVKTQKFNFDGLGDAVKALSGKPVYFSLDLDVLDPSVFSGTGTPEAGGVNFNELIEAVRHVFKLNVVGFDVNELAPIYDHSGASTATACKILREILLAVK
ncbi:MAG: agmatinase, partial [Bacillota bacterium]|nr:agmatinase [Bacillota bacterium]